MSSNNKFGKKPADEEDKGFLATHWPTLAVASIVIAGAAYYFYAAEDHSAEPPKLPVHVVSPPSTLPGGRPGAPVIPANPGLRRP